MATKKKQRRNRRKLDASKIEEQLVALEQKLIRELHQNLGNVQNTSRGDPTELLDIASDGEIDYMAAVFAETGSATIEEVHRAVQKVREGSYGVCEACGKQIKARRLKARPFAVLCLVCKEREERRGYVPRAGAVSARGDAEVTVSLTDEDFERPETSMADLFRNVDANDVELSDLY
ncbi:MAG: hypothetical protein AMK73_07270 [Planctomycetes bacterium SM23_32]|nr:MAG: hypothetical protein AMK73_07270 [Planctomycetes bacterium SM23_32]